METIIVGISGSQTRKRNLRYNLFAERLAVYEHVIGEKPGLGSFQWFDHAIGKRWGLHPSPKPGTGTSLAMGQGDLVTLACNEGEIS